MTATTTTLSAPTTTRDGRALWTRLALMAGGALLGITATMVITNDDDSPARTVSTDGSFRSAAAAEAGRYVEGLESRAVSQSAADVHPSADAAEHWSVSVSASDVHPSADASEQWADTNPYLLPGAYAHGFSYSSNPGVCGRLPHSVC
jgi:hypothetical protein